MSERACKSCGGPIPAGSRRDRQYCSENCRKRRWEGEEYRGACEVCGAVTSKRDTVRCPEHARHREAAAGKRARVAEMWAAGKTTPEIGAAMGWSNRQVGCEIDRMRKLGYDLPYRYSVEHRVAAWNGRWGRAA